MLKLAILKAVEHKNGQVFYRPIFEGEDGDFESELTSRVRRILGPKESFTGSEVSGAIIAAFREYKKEFKGRTVKLP